MRVQRVGVAAAHLQRFSRRNELAVYVNTDCSRLSRTGGPCGEVGGVRTVCDNCCWPADPSATATSGLRCGDCKSEPSFPQARERFTSLGLAAYSLFGRPNRCSTHPPPPPRLVPLSGCTNPRAINFRSIAIVDDSSCLLRGCMDASSVGFDSLATYEDGSCPPTVRGCADSGSVNFRPLANQDDGSCQYVGCMQSTAPNFDARASLPGHCASIVRGCRDEVCASLRLCISPPLPASLRICLCALASASACTDTTSGVSLHSLRIITIPRPQRMTALACTSAAPRLGTKTMTRQLPLMMGAVFPTFTVAR